MKRAILYIRVSTDEQADKGYSLNHQEERLHKYCELHKIEVAAIFQDDHSAKTFERPAFKKLLEFSKKNKTKLDYLFFINWSRFSRNAGDAYAMISQLNKLGIDPQAIEQPLDLSVPENKMMLAFYLAAPEVENDRRSLNVISGMRRARKEGRWVGKAPKGYRNISDEKGNPIIIPGHDKDLIIEAFQEIAKGVRSYEEIRLSLLKKGLKCCKNNFWYLIRNPIYMGKIAIKKYKDEEAIIADGIHEPLISEELFYEVKDILNGKKKNYSLNNTRKHELPLRGFLQCKICGRKFTGSASKGNGGRYFYYHCTNGCKERYKAEVVNSAFIKELKSISICNEIMDIYLDKVKDLFSKNRKESKRDIQKYTEEINKNKERIANAQQLMLDQKIDSDEYKSIKNRYEKIINDLTKDQVNLECSDSDYLKYLEYDFVLLKSIDRYYENSDIDVKQQIIGSIFPENLFFENGEVRTKRINEVVRLITLNTKKLEEIKKETHQKKSDAFEEVGLLGIEPRTT